MFLDFYRLREKPFHTTPDPRFLYLTLAHAEALAQLEYGVRERRGFIVLTGEVGSGKTSLLRAFLQRLGDSAEVAYVVNSMMPFDGILEYVLDDFGIATAGQSRAQRLLALKKFLLQRHAERLDTLIVIDEAQNLDGGTLEQIRQLSNFETTTQKLLQIILVGQPELKEKLSRPELRQLRQRIGILGSIRSLTPKEAKEYILYRIRVARGLNGSAEPPKPEEMIFTDGAMEKIAKYAQGNPRMINTVCDHCLLVGYADQKRIIEPATVREVIGYLEERDGPVERVLRMPRVPFGVFATVLIAVIFVLSAFAVFGDPFAQPRGWAGLTN